MKLFKLRNSFLVVSSICSLQLSAQDYFVKEAWETQTAILSSQHYHAATLLDQSGDIFSVANKRNTTDADIYLNKMNGSGTVTWQNTISNLLNISTTQNYGTDIKRDQQGNTYISGAYFNGTDYDLIVVKYNSSGTELWRRVYNGTGSYDDAAANFVLDASGNVYVTGASFGVNSMTDIVTLKINGSNGTIAWTARYDFNGKYEGGSQIRLDNQGYVYVGGSSAQNNYNADFVALKYNPSNGNQMQVKRQNTPLNGYDIAIGMEIDQNNNVYLYGTANYNVNKDIKLVSYDANLNINWIKYYDGSGLDDEAGGLTIDNSGNPVITGYTKNNQGQVKMLTAKYNKTNGNLIWMEQHETTEELTTSKGKKVKLDSDGNVIVAGEVTLNGVSHVKLISYDPSGLKRWEHVKKNTTLSEQQVLDLIVHGNDIFLTGVAELNNDPNLFTVKLEPKEIVVVPDFAGESPRAVFGLETNAGQLLNSDLQPANNVKFYNDRMNPAVFVTENNFALAFQQGQIENSISVHRVDMDFIGSYPVKKLINLQQEELPGIKNYYLQHAQAGISGIKEYSRVIMADVYENIDVTYYSNSKGMKYYINVKPNANPDNVLLQFTGAQSITLNQDGSLDVHSAYGHITFRKPIAYQLDGNNQPVQLPGQGGFIQVSPNAVKFEIKEFQHDKNLFIQLDQGEAGEDPVRSDNLNWSTYYGGVNFDEFNDNTVDQEGKVYFAGSTVGLDFPAETQITSTLASSVRRMVFGKHDSGGETEWRTIYGSESDIARAITTDVYGNVYITGVSSSNGYSSSPGADYQHHFLSQNVAGAHNQASVNPAPEINSYAFIIKLNQQSGLRSWASLFGENANMALFDATAISCDPEGNVYIAGSGRRVANSPIYAPGSAHNDSESNVFKGFIASFDANTNALGWSTMFGNDDTKINGIHAYGHRYLLITGETGATNIANFPLAEEHPGLDYMQTTYGGGSRDAFVAKFDPGHALQWSTLFGGSDEDISNSISISPSGHIAIGGRTRSLDFPYEYFGNAYHVEQPHGVQDAFITVFHLSGGGYQLRGSTYWGEAGFDVINDVKYSEANHLYLMGTSNSQELRNYMTVMDGAYRQDWLGNDENNTKGNAFLFVMRTSDYRFEWGTYFGGKPNNAYPYANSDEGRSVAIRYNKVYICGASNSQTDFPLNDGDPGAYFQGQNAVGTSVQSDPKNYSDGFIAEFDLTGTDLATTLGMDELALGNENENFLLYPNPTSGEVAIVGKTTHIQNLKEIEILDISGKVVKKITNLQFMNSHAVNFDLTDLPTGFYTVILREDNFLTTMKLIKQ